MSSFRNYSDSASYKTKTGIGASSTFGRNSSAGSNFSNYRSNYSGIGSTSLRTPTVTKGKSIGSTTYTSNFTKKDGDKTEDKPSYKYSCTKNSEKEKSIPVKSTKEESRPRSRCSNGSGSILEKYALGSNKTNPERPSSVLDRYRGTSRETSREPDSTSSRYGGASSSYSESSRSYSTDKKDKDYPYKGMRPASACDSTPESKNPAYRSMYSRTPTFGKTANSSSTSESSSPLSSKYSSATSNSRYSLSSRNNPEHVTATISYTGSERFRSPSVKSAPSSLQEDILKVEEQHNAETRTEVIAQSETQSNGSRTIASKSEQEDVKGSNDNSVKSNSNESNDEELIVVKVVTRGTSPTPPPPLTVYTRTKRLEPIPKPIEKVLRKSDLNKIEMRDQEQQSDREYIEDPPRDRYLSRYGTSGRTSGSPWVSSYLDKFGTSTAASSLYTPRNSYGYSHRLSTPYAYSNKSNENSYASKDSSTRSTSSLSQDADHSDKSNSRVSTSTSSKERNSRNTGRSSPKVEVNSKTRSSEERRSDRSREESPRIVEGQDHERGSNSHRESLSKSSDSSSSTSQSKPGSVSRSGSLKSRHMTSPDSSSSVSMPTGCNGTSNGSRSGSNKAASSTSSGAVAAVATSMTKIKSAVTTTTTTTATSASNSKCSIVSAGSSVSSRQASSPDVRDRKPPVPKSEMVGKNATMGGASGAKYVNKDFRKSALNMENGDPSRSQISDKKHQKKYQRSMSVSSQDSQSEACIESVVVQQVSSCSSMNSVKSNKSASKSRTSTSKSNGIYKDKKYPLRDARRSNSKSPSSCKNGRVSRTVSVSTSECSSEESSSESSNSDEEEEEEDEEQEQRPAGTERRRRRASDSPFLEGKGKMSAGSSRTSILVSSADELSVNTEKPPRPPSSPRSNNDRSAKTDEAKSFLMRALAPVTNLFKAKQQENGGEIKNGGWVEACSEENSDSVRKSRNSMSRSPSQNLTKSRSVTKSEKNLVSDSIRKSPKLRHQSSGEKPWWLDPNSDNVPEGVERNISTGNDDISQDTTISTILPDDGKFKFKIWRQDSEERAWWLDANDNNIPDEELNCPKEKSSKSLSRKSSTRSSRSSMAKRIRHQQSGERAWWLSDDPENVPDGIEIIPVSPAPSRKTESTDSKPIARRIKHVESGERPWWLDSSSNVPEGVQKIPTETSNSDSSESYEKVDIRDNKPNSGSRGLSRFPIDDEPLGDRASPEGIENPPDPPDSYSGRTSPYDNVTNIQLTLPLPRRSSAPRKRPADLPLFIGNQTNIDDLLGDLIGPSHSPILAGNQNQQYPEGMLSESSDEECKEIDPGQVIIHDSTPQTPVIQRRHRDTDRPQPDGYIPISVSTRSCSLFHGAVFICKCVTYSSDMLLRVILALLHASSPSSSSNIKEPKVTTPLGDVFGNYKTSYNGRKYEVYEGIPYAKPPTGDLRFKDPIAFGSWGSLRATNGSKKCTQYIDIPPDKNGHRVTEGRVQGEEDCLYLSINVPVVKRKTKLPVIFFIHGGSFQYGSGLGFGGSNKYLADKDVIFVTPNYRLGVLGFLSTEDDVVSGNMGLKDQNLALRWTSKYIKHFGGDPNKIILVGFSAGSSSIQYHYVSPMSRGLFHGSIAISGAIPNPWGFAVHANEKAKKLGSIFNCPTDSSRSLVDCLKQKSAQSLTGATEKFQYWQFMPEAPFAPVIEKGRNAFIDKNPKEIFDAKESYDVPAVFGAVSDEGCDPGAAYAPHDNLLKDLNDNWETIAPYLLQYNYTEPKNLHEKIAKEAREEYFGDKNIDKDTALRLIKMLTHKHYFIGIQEGIRLQAKASKSPVYFYFYSFKGSQSRSEDLSHTNNDYGVCHCDDVMLVVENDLIDPSKTKQELTMSNFFADMWESVAYNGKPKIDVDWQPVNANSKEINYLQIYEPGNYSMSGDSNFGNTNFWQKVLSNY